MNRKTTSASTIVGFLTNKSQLSNFEISRRLKRHPTFIGRYLSRKSVPSIALVVKIAAICGYEVHLIGHDEDITVTVDETD